MGGEIPWVEKYRPTKLDDVIGQANIIECLKQCVAERNIINMIFAGPPGSGKTSVALALAHEIYGPAWSENVLCMNASDERGIDVVRGKIKDFARTLPVSGVDWKICILDEADALTADAQQALRRTIEMFAANTRFIFIANYSSKIIEPIQSRCAVLRFSALSNEEIRRMIHRIVNNEKLKIDDGAINALIEISEGDMRCAINILQSASLLSRNITEDSIYKIAARARPEEISQMINFALKGEFAAAHEKLDVLLGYMSGEDIISQIYKEIIARPIDDGAKVRIIDKIGEFNFRLVQGASERIQLAALLAYLVYEGANILRGSRQPV